MARCCLQAGVGPAAGGRQPGFLGGAATPRAAFAGDAVRPGAGVICKRRIQAGDAETQQPPPDRHGQHRAPSALLHTALIQPK